MTNSKRLSSADVDALSTEYSTVNATKTASFEQLALGQKVSFQPERNGAKWYRKLFALPAYYWVLIAQVVVVLPHAAHLPLWLIGFAAVSIAAQLPYIKAKFKKLSHLKRIYQSMQMLGFLLGLLGLWLTYNTAFGLDMGVAFLVLCLVSKLWELYKRRDAYVVLNLSLFVLAALFLMDQGLLTTLEVIVGAVIVLLAFIALNDDSNVSGDGRLRTLGVLGVGALPLLVVLFLFFPRLPPLWSVQLSGQQATTGVSDSMSPGDFANLGQSTELAFRVEFADERPPQQQLYWRGLVFSDFDGVTWRPAPQKDQWSSRLQAPAWIQNAFATVPDEERAAPVNYKVILEPTQQNWLFGLDYPFSQQPDINTTSEFTLSKDQPVTQQLRYDVLQFAQMRIDPVLTEASRRENLALPNEGNPQSRALAKQLFEQSGSDPVRYIAAIEQWINRTEFRYTLSPPRLNTNRIDEFLFETKAGFCEHYSSSFTFMLRAAGIPARVVAGYQGGEPSRNGSVWEVRQMDAHAWTEVWLEGQGWVRVDPTAFVAPERVEQGMNTMTEQQGAAMFGNGASAQISYQQYQMLQTLRRLSDQASYYWQKDVVGYDQDKQADSLLKWFNISSIMQQIIWLATSAVSVMAILVFVIWYRRRKRWHPADLPLAKLSKRVAKHDKLLARNDNEGQLAWLERLASAIDSRKDNNAHSATSQLTDSSDLIVIQTKLIEIRQNYRQLRYGRLSTFDSSHSEYQERLKQLKKDVRALL
ncbi:transglutaminaseTgpA domain-containing protein [Psychrobacter proteolyticus]|uniref:transglutaminase family protein n=1 Tax=Psychrobacter proteolyticus TaxID=147825 RepID=UPI003D0692B1